MNGYDCLALLIVCAAIVIGLSIICYTINHILTRDNLLRAIRDLVRILES